MQKNSKLIIKEKSDEGVLRLVMNNLDQKNALSQSMMSILIDEIKTTSLDQSIKVIVIAANGNVFSSGHDLKEITAAREKKDELEVLLNYVIGRHYPDIKNSKHKAIDLLTIIIEKQINLVVDWMRVGFIHGVMNTDNVSISGETIDYGPCAFMDTYDPKTVFSSIDQMGRYAYCNQPVITKWNLSRFAECLIPLIDKNQKKRYN